MTTNCNYWYAGTDMIDIGNHQLICSCGIFITYVGDLLYYSHRTDPVNMRDLTLLLKEAHI